MLKSGLVSVSFRALPPEKIVPLAAEAGLAGIEWGGDVHVPPGDVQRAKEVRALTRSYGLAVSSYGSYYRLGEHGAGYLTAFAQTLQSALALGAPTVRIWAGTRGSAETGREERALLVEECRAAAAMADAAGITLAFECHGNTLTDDRASFVRLMEEVNAPNVKMYWQPNERFDRAYNLAALRDALPYLSNLHVFQWPRPGVRLPLAEGAEEWTAYFASAAAVPGDRWCLLEFMPDDRPESLAREAETLLSLLAR